MVKIREDYTADQWRSYENKVKICPRAHHFVCAKSRSECYVISGC